MKRFFIGAPPAKTRRLAARQFPFPLNNNSGYCALKVAVISDPQGKSGKALFYLDEHTKTVSSLACMGLRVPKQPDPLNLDAIIRELIEMPINHDISLAA